MPESNQSDIFALVTELRGRTGRKYEEVRELMTERMGVFEYSRDSFNNKFRRRDRNPHYELDELLALIHAFTVDLDNEVRCTAYEACQLFGWANMRLEDFEHLKEFVNDAEFAEASDRYVQEHGLGQRENDREGHVFICHSQNDRPVANQLRALAKQRGYDVWQDVAAIIGSSEWINAINKGINGCYAFVVIVSQPSAASQWVRGQILHAQRRSKPIIPICIDSTPLPVGLQQLNCIDAQPDLKAGIVNLLDTLSLYSKEVIQPVRSRRQMEIDYLDRVVLAYGIWQTIYTPMAGESHIVRGERHNYPMASQEILQATLEGFDQVVDEVFHETQVQSYPKDILSALDPAQLQCMVLGDSGSGKTTTLRHLTGSLAETARQSKSQPVPVLVELGKVEQDQSLEDYIKEQINELTPWYDDMLQEGRIALLLDGLNEIPLAMRTSILNDIRAYASAAISENRLMAISCRAADYTHDLDIGIARRFYIKPLDPIRIRQFIDTYVQPSEKADELFWTLAGAEARRFWDRFIVEVEDLPEIFWLHDQLLSDLTWGYGGVETQFYYWNQWLDVRSSPNSLLQLARNPYMLSMMTQVFITQDHIPDNRAKLFGAFMDYVLMRREGLPVAEAAELMRRLASLAYAIQFSAIPTSATREIAQHYLGDEAHIRRAQAANILEADTSVRFTHQLLQHYFAALELNSMIETEAAASNYWPPDSWWEPNVWNDTAILLAGLHAADTSPVVTWLQDTAPETAARCMVESGSKTPASLRHILASRWVARLDEESVAARAAIGRAIGLTDADPRPGVGLNSDGLPDMDWVEVPAGEFIYGEGEKHQFNSFAISRYPLTYLQFQAFIEAEDGFYNPAWWTDLQQEDVPGVQSFPFSNHPRERVSWYDAIAFCRWLSHHLGYVISLPNEYQWEKAARGPEGLIYPYGSVFNAQCSNVAETEINQTTAVGLFAAGASPYGVLDMSGNVFEWCLNLETGPDHVDFTSTEPRSLRGGSWAHSAERARADYRYANRPELRRNRVGFRPIRIL
ncbi:MAG: hypothetical protein CL610_06530 [Anaerolineaceae bacterium]|nr:hypothetical protein [Anaerolineaceae bacterium]